MFTGVVEELRAMVARVEELAASVAGAGLEFEADALEDLAGTMRLAITEMVDANMALRAIVPTDVAQEVRAVLEAHGFVAGAGMDGPALMIEKEKSSG